MAEVAKQDMTVIEEVMMTAIVEAAVATTAMTAVVAAMGVMGWKKTVWERVVGAVKDIERILVEITADRDEEVTLLNAQKPVNGVANVLAWMSPKAVMAMVVMAVAVVV